MGKRRTKKKRKKQKPKAPSGQERRVHDAPVDPGERLIANWERSRSGARAGRGFHFQDAAGAWLASMIAIGRLRGTLTPEGFDDMSVEGPGKLNVQVKSRQDRLGPFPKHLAAAHIADSWAEHHARGTTGRLVVVFERGITGFDQLDDLTTPLEKHPDMTASFLSLLQTAGSRHRLTKETVAQLLARTAVIALDWAGLTARTHANLNQHASLPPAAQALVAQRLRRLVADATDHNAASTFDQRHTITRNEVAAALSETTSQLDLASLEEALISGACTLLGAPEPAGDDSYYEGVSTQPCHVAQGLVVPRPELIAGAITAVDHRRSVVFTGPSGIGKSATMWILAAALQGILWFRVHRLISDDVAPIIRLCNAYRPTPDSPVGLLVDGAGTGGNVAWNELRALVDTMPGVVLVASARTEDLPALGDLSSCSLVEVRLDEMAAQAMYDGLVRRRATVAPHWSEAFQSSNGLTMEFTHLLTKGQRLQDVVDSQMADRIASNRNEELALLSLISVADMWSASLSTTAVADELDINELELRRPLTRLVNEHLVAESDGELTGLHPLRSAAISHSLHRTPPPRLARTVEQVLRIAPAPVLHRFIANMLRAEPPLVDVVLSEGFNQQADVARFTGILHGLRLFDFDQRAHAWHQIALRYEIKPSTQSPVFMFALSGVDLAMFPDPVKNAATEMVETNFPSTRDELATQIGEHHLTNLLSGCADLATAARYLASLGHLPSTIALTPGPGSSVAQALRSTDSLEQLGDCLAVARAVNPALADHLLELAGGTDHVLDQIRLAHPWVTDLGTRQEPDGHQVAFAQLLHVSDRLGGDPTQTAHALGRILLKCLPHIDSVDIRNLLAGGHPIGMHDYESGISKLKRGYERAHIVTSWNQAAMELAHSLVAESDTSRLATALPLLDETVEIARGIITTLFRGHNPNARKRIAELDDQRMTLHDAAHQIRPSVISERIAASDIGQPTDLAGNNDLSSIITNITDNVLARVAKSEEHRRLAAMISDTLLARQLPKVKAEPWYLLGLDKHPSSLDDLEATLDDTAAVLVAMSSGDLTAAEVGKAARSGSPKRAIERCAEAARKATHRRRSARVRSLASQLTASPVPLRLWRAIDDRTHPFGDDFIVTVEVGSLFEWLDHLDEVTQLLHEVRESTENFAIVPIRNGKTIRALAMRLIQNLFPSPGYDRYPDSIPPDLTSTTLTHAFGEAVEALQELSALSSAEPHPHAHDQVQHLADDIVATFEASVHTIQQLGADLVVDELVHTLGRWAVQVQNEHETEEAEAASFASRVAAGVTRNELSPEYTELIAARVLSIEWDLDRRHAAALLAESDELA